MNTRGKKIEFAEMLGSNLRLSEKTAAKTAKTSKRRTTSFDGTKSDVSSAGKRSSCLPLLDLEFSSQCPKSELSYDDREGKDDPSVRFQIEDSGWEDFVAGDPQVDAEENGSGLQESTRISAPVFGDRLSFAKDQILCDKQVKVLAENDDPVTKCPDALPVTMPSPKTAKRGCRQDVQNPKKLAEDFPKDCSPSGNLPDSGGGRSTRRNRPLDYKCLAGLREYGQRKRKSLEDDTANSCSPTKFNASIATRFSKKLCLDGARVSAYKTHEMPIKMEVSDESRLRDQSTDANGYFGDSASRLSSADAKKSRPFNTISSVPFVSLQEHKASADDGCPSEAVETKAEIKSVKEEVCCNDFADGSFVDSSRVDLSFRNECTSGTSGDNQVKYVKADSGALKDTARPVGFGSEAPQNGSDSEIPAAKCREVTKRPYDNAQISSLICKIEARMNRLKNSCDLSSANQANNPLSVRAREKKLNCSAGAKAKEKDYNRGNCEETTAVTDNWKFSPTLEDKQRKTPYRGEFSGSSSGQSSSFSSGKSNSSTEFQEIGKTRLHARKSLALSLARAASTSEKATHEVEKSSLKPAHGGNAAENVSSAQKDDGKPSLRIKIYKYTNAGVPSEYSTSSKPGLDVAPAGRSAQMTSRKSVFTSPELDDYLESNSRHPYVKEKEKEKAVSIGPEIDEVEGFTFLAFMSERALEDYMKKLNAERDAGGHPENYEQSQYAAEEYTACRAKQLALERAGKIRRFGAGELSDLGLVIKPTPGYFAYPEPCPDEGASVGKVTRRGIGKMGNEKRQPRKGKIYGRKVTGRFASKANIKYYVKKRSPDSLSQIDKKNIAMGKSAASKQTTTVVKNETLNLVTEEDLMPVILTMRMAIAAAKALRVESTADKPCNQEDCICVGRRGVQPSYESDQSGADLPAQSVECRHEHCRLGCVCESLRTPQKRKPRNGHCGRPECMFDCACDPTSLLQSPSGNDNVEKEPERLLSFTRKLFQSAESKESVGEPVPPLNINSNVRPVVKRRKRRGWGIPLDEGLNIVDDATSRTDKDGHLLRKSGRIKERRRFSDIEKMKSLIYFDASLWLREDKGPQRRKRGDRSSRTDTAAPLQFSTPEASITHTVPSGSEPAIQETCGNTAALKSDPPVTWEISDDEKPHGLAPHAKEGCGKQSLSFNSISASASIRPEDKQRSKLLTGKSNPERAYLVSSDNDDAKDSDDESVGDEANSTCARMLMYDRSLKRFMEETSDSYRKNKTSSGALKSRPGFTNTREASQKMSSSRKAPDPVQNKFTKSVMLVKKNPTGRDKPEGKRLTSPVILLDIMCNCSWQEYRDPIVGKVYEMVAEGQAVAGNSFELQSLLVELMPKSEKELVIPKNIMETTQAADLHVVPIRITKRPDPVKASLVQSGNAVKIPLVPSSEARSSAASESGGIGLSGMKRFVTGGFPATASLMGGSSRLATSCTFGPFPSVAVTNNVPEAQSSIDDVGEASAACLDAVVDLSSDSKLSLSATRWCDAAPSSCTKELSATGLEDMHDDCEAQLGVMNLSTKIDPPTGLENEATGEHLTEPLETGLDCIRKSSSEDAGNSVAEKNEETSSLSLLQTVPGDSEAVQDRSCGAKVDSTDLELSLMSSAVSNIDSSSCRVSPTADSKTESSVENCCSTSSEPSGQIVLTNSFKMNPQVFDSLPPATACTVVAPPVAISSLSVSVCPKLIPVSNVRFVTVGATTQKSHITSDVVSSSVTPRPSAPIVRTATGVMQGSLPRAPLKPGSFILATSSGGSSGVTLKPTPVQVIPPAMIVASRASGVPPPSVPCGTAENLAAGKCIFVPATKLLRLGVPLEKGGAGKSGYFPRVLKKGVSGSSGPGRSLPGVDFVQVKPVVSPFLGKQTVTISTSMIPAHKPMVSVVPQSVTLGSTTSDGKTATIHTKVKGSRSDVIEIPDDSDEEKCPDVIDILQAEVDGSNEAMILREKLGLPVENSASKQHGATEQSQSTMSATQKKKRKQMHEEKTELAMNVEFTESWVAVPPGDIPEEKSDPKEDTSSKEPVPVAAAPSEEGAEIPKPKDKCTTKLSTNASNPSSSVFLELYSGLFRAVAQYLMRSGEVKKKMSKLYIIRKAIKVIKHLTERNRIFVNALVTEKLTNERLRARLKALRAVRSSLALEVEMPDSSDHLASSEASSSGNRLPSEKRRVSGPLRRKFRGITKKEELEDLSNGQPENAGAWKPDPDPVVDPVVLPENKTTPADVEPSRVEGDDVKSAETCGAYATADEPLDSAQGALPEDLVASVCATETEISSGVGLLGDGLLGDGVTEGDRVIDSECQKFVSELVVADVLEEVVDSGMTTDQ